MILKNLSIAPFILILLMSQTALAASTVTNNSDPNQLRDALAANFTGVHTLGAATAVGEPGQLGTFDNLDFGKVDNKDSIFTNTGIMLSTGTLIGAGVNSTLAEADVAQALTDHPSFSTNVTYDAASLTFTFEADPDIKSVVMEVMYATSESIGNTSYLDAAVIMVDGVNVATFSNGLLLSNLNGEFLFASATTVNGFANVSNILTISGALDLNLTTHTIKIAIANNNDGGVESAILLGAIKGSTLSGSGIIEPVINEAPVISGTPATTVAEDATYNFTPTATDADTDDTQTFSITNMPTWASFNTSTGALTGTPTQNHIGTTSGIVITVKDAANATDSLTAFGITVTNTNDAPIISGTPITTIAEDAAYSFTPTVSDADVGDSKTFSISNKPNWASFDVKTGQLSGAPSNEHVGTTARIVITVKDSKGVTDSLVAFNLEVINTNDAPVITGTPAVTVGEDATYSFTPSAMDIDADDTLIFSITNKPNWASFDEVTGALTGTPLNEDVGATTDIVITVTDSGDESASLTAFDIEVTNTNDAPVAQDDVIALTFSEAGIYTLDVLSNDIDEDGDSLTIINASSSIGSASIVEGQLIYSMSGVVDGDIVLDYAITDGHANTGNNEDDGKNKAQVTLSFTNGIDALLPVMTLPADIDIDSTALLTKVDLGVATAVDRNGEQIPVSLVDSITRFKPGNHLVYWQSQDSDGFKRIATQRVAVKPLVTIGKDRQGSGEGHYKVGVYLNGESPSYPVIIGYSVAGDASDDTHNLVPGTVVIESGVMGYIEFDTFSGVDVDADASLVIALDDDMNLGAKSTFTLTLTQDNIAPTASVTVLQNSEQRTLVSKIAGEVVITASVYDANSNDSHTYLWESASGDLIDSNANSDDATFTFDPANLTAGQQQLTLTVTDSGSTPSSSPLSTDVFVYLDVVDILPVLTDADADGDLIPDNVEGYSDTDNDGIADYLDSNNTQCNVQPEEVDDFERHLVESESSSCLRRGTNTTDDASGSLLLATDEVSTDDDATNVGGIFDFILSGLPVAGQSVSVVLPQRLPIPDNAIYRKLMTSAGWVDFVVDSNNYYSSTAGENGYCPSPNDNSWTTGLTAGHWCVQVTIEDGGPNDDDGVANNQIVDPGGVAIWNNSNTLPTIISEQVATTQNKLVVIDVLANDTDSDNDTLIIISADVDFGTVTIVDGQLQYQPQANFFGLATINYGVSDGNNGTGYGEVSIDVIENTAPVTVNDSASTDDRSMITIDVLANDSDIDNDTLTLISTTAIQGQVSISNNALTYTPLSGFDGVDTVTYVIDDNNGGQSEGEVTITIDAYETITITNESSGGSVGGIVLLMSGIMVFMRRKRTTQVGKRNALNPVTKKRVTACLSVLALCGLSVGSQAADVSELNYFVQAQLGQSKVKQANLNQQLPVGVAVQVDDSTTGWSVGMGVNVSPSWSFSLNYIDMGEGEVTITGDTLTAGDYHQSVANVAPVLVQGVGIDARYHFLRGDDYNIMALVGALAWDSEVVSNMGTQRLTQKDDGLDGYYGIEGTYKFNEMWSMSLGMKRYALDVNTIDTTYIGLTYQF